MIWNLITGFLPDVWPYLAGALALVGGWFVAKRQGAQGHACAVRSVGGVGGGRLI